MVKNVQGTKGWFKISEGGTHGSVDCALKDLDNIEKAKS
jgi:hypothetical protein